MDITKDQAQNLLDKGYSRDQVVQFIKQAQNKVSGEISGGDISRHPVKSLVSTFMQPASQSLFGKTVEEEANAISQSPSMGQSSSAPYDKNLGMVRTIAGTMNLGGQALDTAQTPSTYAIAPILKGVGLVGKTIAKPFQEAIALSKELSKDAESVGSSSKTPSSIIRKMSDNLEKEVTPLKNSIIREETDFKDVKKSLEKEMSNKKDIHNDTLELTKNKQKDIRDSVKEDLDSKESSLKEALQGKAEDITRYMKEEIPDQISSMNDLVGKHIDSIADDMASNGKGITKLDSLNLYKKTLDEADKLGIKTGRARGLLEQLNSSAEKDIKGEDIDTGLLNAEGKPIISKSSGRGQELIPFKDFLHQSREFKRLLNESKLSGAQGLNDEDIVGAIYNKHLDHYMEQNVGGYKSLMKDYAPVINTMKAARRIFKPGNQYSDEQGVSLLKKYAMGSTTSGKEELVGDLGKSSRFGSGMNTQASDLKSIGSQLKNVQENIKKFPRTLQKKFDKEISDIKSSHEKEMGNLQQQLDKSQGQSQMKIDAIKDRISDIESNTKDRISHIQDVSDKLQSIKQRGKVAVLLGLVGLETIGRKGEDVKHLLMH